MTTTYRIRLYAAVLGALIVVFVMGTIFGPRRARELGEVYPGINADEVNRVEVSSTDLTLALRRDGEQWVMEEGAESFPARADRVDSFVSEATGSGLVRRVTANEDLWDDFGLNEIDATEVTLHSETERGDQSASAVWGAPSAEPGLSYVRRPDASDVYSSDGQLSFYLGQPVSYWSYLRVLPENVTFADVVSVSSRASVQLGEDLVAVSYELNRGPGNPGTGSSPAQGETWTAEDGAMELDGEDVVRYLREIADLVGSDFHRGGQGAGQLSEAGAIEFFLSDGRSFGISVLSSADGYLCRATGPGLPGDRFGGLVYELSESTLRRLFPELDELVLE